MVVERERPGVVIEEFVERRLMRGAPANRPELARAETPDAPRATPPCRWRRPADGRPRFPPRPRMRRIGTVIAPYDRMLRLALLGLVTTWLTTLVRLMRSSRAAVPAPAGERALPQRRA